jgi:peroxiredoxin Q/BCP
MFDKGPQAPEFCLPDKDNREVCLSDYSGKWVVLYFYPEDSSPGCTREALEFSQGKADFEKLNAAVIGISPDSPESHGDFASRNSLDVTLLSDQGHEVLDDFEVCRSELIDGLGRHQVGRATFLIDPQGMVRHVWKNVSVNNHSAEVGERLMQLEGLM